jgi:hypothetical protein
MVDPVEPKSKEDWEAIAKAQMFLKEQYRDAYMKQAIRHNGFRQATFMVLSRILRMVDGGDGR